MPPRLPFTCLRRVSVTAGHVQQKPRVVSAYTRHRRGRQPVRSWRRSFHGTEEVAPCGASNMLR